MNEIPGGIQYSRPLHIFLTGEVSIYNGEICDFSIRSYQLLENSVWGS